MGGKIECYVDIASYYSYMAFSHLMHNQELLKQNNITVEIFPIIIGAFNAATGNSPPWTVKTKAKYLRTYDAKRVATAMGLKDVTAPGDLMKFGRTILPMRALTHIKSAFPSVVYTAALGYFFHAFWTLHKAPNDVPVLTEVLSEIPAGFQLANLSLASKSGPLFTREQVAEIVEATTKPELKAAMKARVDEALARGAFGAPWIWLTDARGRAEPVFGSDRWDVVYEFLGLPYQKLQLLPPPQEKAML